jgi:hypothetical protein
VFRFDRRSSRSHRPALPPPAHKHAANPAEPVQDPHRHTDRATPPLASRCVKGIAHSREILDPCLRHFGRNSA